MALAAFRGLLDYSKFNPTNPLDLLREKFVFRQLNRDIMAELLKLKFQQQLAKVSLRTDSEDSVAAYNSSVELYTALGSVLEPWGNWPKPATKNLTIDNVADWQKEWEQVYGSLQDPANQHALRIYERLADQYKQDKLNAGEAAGQWVT